MAEKTQDTLKMYEETFKVLKPGTIVKGKVVRVDENHALIDIGYKSEGSVLLKEFAQPVKVGDEVNVVLEQLENDEGVISLSKQKAEQLESWQNLLKKQQLGEIIKGKVVRKVKGGFIIDMGVEAFLPLSQLYSRQQDISRKTLSFKIIKMDDMRRNIVVSEKGAVEAERGRDRAKLLASLEKGQTCKGTVKNITDFGAFIDIGGIDGLLHITDISWGRVSHPSEVLAIGDEIEVVILDFEADKGKVSLGLKQKTQSPWLKAGEKYPAGSKHTGRVVNITDYGAFVELEKGIEGLVHISEMSWIKRLSHPSEMVAIGDMVEAVVLNIDPEKQKIALGMKQVEPSPWVTVKDKYPVGSTVKGKIRNITDYGAFLEIEKGIDGLIHISDISWSNVKHPSEVLKKGDKVEAVVLEIDPENRRISLGLKQLKEDPWEKIGDRYHEGDKLKGKVTKIVPFGAFVEIEEGIEGLLHVSKMERLGGKISEGDILEVVVVNVERERRKIGLDIAEK